MSILDCYGQDRAVWRLQQARRARRLPHSYIFHGPDGVGKSLLARQWAQLLLCPQAETVGFSSPVVPDLLQIEDSCGQCRDCHLVGADTHPDLHIINRELIRHTAQGRDRKMIDLPVDVVREFLIEVAGMHPARGRARVFIVEEAETMNRAAQNSLLKTLEEPPDSTFIILVTSRIDLFLPTVRSRCQPIRFVPLPEGFVRGRLDEAGVDPSEGRYWADFTAGELGPALQLAQMGIYKTKCQLVEQLAGLTGRTVLEFAGNIAVWAKEYANAYLEAHPGRSQAQATRLGFDCIGQMITHAFRQALRASAGAKGAGFLDQPALIESLAGSFGAWGCSQAIRATWRAQATLSRNVNPTLIFESLMLNYLDYARPGSPRAGRAG